MPCKCVNSLFVFFLFITLFILCNFFFFSVCVLFAIRKKFWHGFFHDKCAVDLTLTHFRSFSLAGSVTVCHFFLLPQAWSSREATTRINQLDHILQKGHNYLVFHKDFHQAYKHFPVNPKDSLNKTFLSCTFLAWFFWSTIDMFISCTRGPRWTPSRVESSCFSKPPLLFLPLFH